MGPGRDRRCADRSEGAPAELERHRDVRERLPIFERRHPCRERRTVGEGFAPTATGQSPSRLVRWSTGEMVLAVGLAVAAIAGSNLFRIGTDTAGRWFVASTVLNAVFLLVPLGLLFFRHQKPLLSTMLPSNRLAQDFGWGLSLGLLVAAINALSVQHAVKLWSQGGAAQHPTYYQMIFRIGEATPGSGEIAFMRPLLLFTMSWGVFSPIAEEVFFRGFLYAALRRKMRAPRRYSQRRTTVPRRDLRLKSGSLKVNGAAAPAAPSGSTV
jgi:membrane protease YdiL (CAAX protease family)